MISVKQRNQLVRAIGRVVRASVSDAWKGAGHPEDIPATEAELKAAKGRLKQLLDEITEPCDATRTAG